EPCGARPRAALRLVSPGIPAQQLVRAVARERDLHVLAREAGQVVQREGGSDRERLTRRPCDVEEGPRVLLSKGELVMDGAQCTRGLRRRRPFVEAAATGKAHG